jgi:hypothetical protein
VRRAASAAARAPGGQAGEQLAGLGIDAFVALPHHRHQVRAGLLGHLAFGVGGRFAQALADPPRERGEERLPERAGLRCPGLGGGRVGAGHRGRGLHEQGVEQQFDRTQVVPVADERGEPSGGPVHGAAVVGIGDLREQLRLRLLVGPLDDHPQGLRLALALAGARQQGLVEAVAGDELLRLLGERLGLGVRVGRFGLRQERPDLLVHAGGLGPAEAVHDRGAARQGLHSRDPGEAVEGVERFEERGPPHDPVPAAEVGAGFGDVRVLDVPGEFLALDDPAVAQMRLGVLRQLAAHEDGPGADRFGAERLPEGAQHFPGHPALLPGELDRVGAE